MLFGEAAGEAKRLSLDLFEKMLDCLDKYVGRKKMDPNVVSFSFSFLSANQKIE